MGGNDGIGLGNNMPPIVNYPGVGNVGNVGGVQQGGALPPGMPLKPNMLYGIARGAARGIDAGEVNARHNA